MTRDGSRQVGTARARRTKRGSVSRAQRAGQVIERGPHVGRPATPRLVVRVRMGELQGPGPGIARGLRSRSSQPDALHRRPERRPRSPGRRAGRRASRRVLGGREGGSDGSSCGSARSSLGRGLEVELTPVASSAPIAREGPATTGPSRRGARTGCNYGSYFLEPAVAFRVVRRGLAADFLPFATSPDGSLDIPARSRSFSAISAISSGA